MNQWMALLLSLAVEIPCVLLLSRLLRPRPGLPRTAAVAATATLLTHPLAYQLTLLLRPLMPFVWRAAVIEGAVVLVEGALFAKVGEMGWKKGLAVALVANALSFAVGLLVYRFWR